MSEEDSATAVPNELTNAPTGTAGDIDLDMLMGNLVSLFVALKPRSVAMLFIG